MSKLFTRTLSLMLVLLMCLSLMPTTVLAADVSDEELPVVETVSVNEVVSNGKPKITTNPSNVSCKQGEKVKFKVVASGKNLKYQWYYRKNSSSSWTKYEGMTSATLSFKAGRRNGYQYRCKVSNSAGHVYSKAATLKVNYVKYRALLVGEVHFSWETANRNKGDVKLLNSMLKNIKPPKGGSYSITYKYDLSNAGIKNAISTTFAKADSNDVSLFFIATHGVVDISSGEWAGALLTTTSSANEDYLKLGDLASWLKAVKGKVIVFIGSCGSGAAIVKNGDGSFTTYDPDAFNQAVVEAFATQNELIEDPEGDVVSNTGEFRSSKFYVLTAAKHQESSWGREGSDPYNFFSYYLAKGGKGAADADGNKKVTLNELYKYVYKKAKGPYYDGTGYYYQHARVYPSDSTYVLFKKK